MAAIRESFAVNPLIMLEKLVKCTPQEPHQTPLHQYVRTRHQLWPNGVPQPHHWQIPHRKTYWLFGYLNNHVGLTQLFHEKSELLMMSTNRIKVDLGSTNTNVIGLALCVVSEICTVELAKELQGEVLKCVENKSNYIKKKAILTAIKLIKKIP